MRRPRLVVPTALVAALVVLVVGFLPSGGAGPRAAALGARPLPTGDLRLVNWFPTDAGWSGLWTDWRPEVIDRDFTRIAALGAESVRVITFPRDFGYPQPRPEMLGRLRATIEAADRHGLRVGLTLFDWWDGFADVDGGRQWMRAVVDPYRADRRLAFVELKGELDPGDPVQVAWARALLPELAVAAAVPTTISAPWRGGLATFGRLVEALDGVDPTVYSLHYYGAPERATATFRRALILSAPVPLIVGEAGASSLGSTRDAERAQAAAMRSVQRAAREVGLPPAAPWTLNDFAPGAIPAHWQGAQRAVEYRYGLLRVDGSAKPAARVVSAAFAAAAAERSASSRA